MIKIFKIVVTNRNNRYLIIFFFKKTLVMINECRIYFHCWIILLEILLFRNSIIHIRREFIIEIVIIKWKFL